MTYLLIFHSASIYSVFNIFYVQHRMGVSTGWELAPERLSTSQQKKVMGPALNI